MTSSSKPRLVWFDANRVFAAFGVVLIHSSTDFDGQAFPDAAQGDRFVPVFLRSIGEFSGSEMFFMFSLFLMAMRVDKKMPTYGSAIATQAQRLLVPFVFWAVFYAFFRLLKADTFDYAPDIWDQLGQAQSWIGYLILGQSQYHMHFLPTLFALFLFYPVMRSATRFPILGLTVVITIGVMNNAQGFLWALEIDPVLRDYLVRALKVLGYVGYGMAAFAIYGLWNDGIPRGESRLIRRCGFYFAILAYVATLPSFHTAFETGFWGVRGGWDFYGHFLMPIFVFFVFIGGQYLQWSPRWTVLASYTFGVYLVHPLVIDLFDIIIFGSGLSVVMDPWMIVVARFAVALPASFALAYGLSQLKPLAWTIGLGPTPWDVVRSKRAGA
ncbi:acyltransferase [Octadecabacter sp. G9-8]|uniref:Acyltransferase n=1 Tax=Octadecabacter dasysiphoniae TaxID=2909341 RepID=A0ABS9CRJ8_9RHOB|nr:acyltransferase [Octadecabacter dasysiphoniae]MCF2869860.1 acyltransferase [Octadecabacter dasysiphoniae]